ncbi:predicted protein [Sclerotinia sclerotiorum 1980 UF-70]|uniref:Uncharacterized protein n=1 Tax=Sclerotinia sclerotiorum (strain ATCC 18683 / 1980 / Ss-1) TaxID=665079 RepID=A7F1I2_SCLS1|nr:predicted protein [Sclerotinia sclerotiorum 1980 UF-70]EDN95574.1 predicted protein [Sclerotinia sclerotiorum 1980 UF-70]
MLDTSNGSQEATGLRTKNDIISNSSNLTKALY